MTKQEENINRITDTRLKDRIWKGLDQEIINLIEAYMKGAGTMPGSIWNKAVELLTKHFEDELAARIKERDERMMKTARDSGNNQIQRELEARCALTREDVEKLIYTVRFVADRDSSSEGLKDIYFLRDKLQAILDAMGGEK